MTFLELLRGIMVLFFRLARRLIFFVGGCAAILFAVLLVAEGIASLFKPSAKEADSLETYTKAALLKSADLIERDVRLFVRPTILGDYLKLYDGLRLSPTWFPLTWTGPEIKLGSPLVTASVGHVNATAEISAWHLAIALELAMVFEKIDVTAHQNNPKDDDCDLIFVAHVRRITATGHFQEFLQAALPRVTHFTQLELGRLVEWLANTRYADGTYPLQIKLSVPRRVVLPLDVDQKDRLPFYPPNGDPPEIGNIVLRTVMPETRITRFFDYDYPIITSDGIWLFASVQSKEPDWITFDRLLANAKPMGQPTAAGLAEALWQLSSKTPANADLEYGVVAQLESDLRCRRRERRLQIEAAGTVRAGHAAASGEVRSERNSVVQLGGLEPPTSCSTDRRSNQLSYNCIRVGPLSKKAAPNGPETRCNIGLWQGRHVGNISFKQAESKSPGNAPGLEFRAKKRRAQAAGL